MREGGESPEDIGGGVAGGACCAAATDSPIKILSINGADRGIGFPMSANEWVEMKTVRHLRAGANDIALRADAGSIDVDYLRFDLQPRGRISPLVEYPQISPRRNTFCRGSADPAHAKLTPASPSSTSARQAVLARSCRSRPR